MKIPTNINEMREEEDNISNAQKLKNTLDSMHTIVKKYMATFDDEDNKTNGILSTGALQLCSEMTKHISTCKIIACAVSTELGEYDIDGLVSSELRQLKLSHAHDVPSPIVREALTIRSVLDILLIEEHRMAFVNNKSGAMELSESDWRAVDAIRDLFAPYKLEKNLEKIVDVLTGRKEVKVDGGEKNPVDVIRALAACPRMKMLLKTNGQKDNGRPKSPPVIFVGEKWRGEEEEEKKPLISFGYDANLPYPTAGTHPNVERLLPNEHVDKEKLNNEEKTPEVLHAKNEQSPARLSAESHPTIPVFNRQMPPPVDFRIDGHSSPPVNAPSYSTNIVNNLSFPSLPVPNPNGSSYMNHHPVGSGQPVFKQMLPTHINYQNPRKANQYANRAMPNMPNIPNGPMIHGGQFRFDRQRNSYGSNF